jgi:hypothetical protein
VGHRGQLYPFSDVRVGLFRRQVNSRERHAVLNTHLQRWTTNSSWHTHDRLDATHDAEGHPVARAILSHVSNDEVDVSSLTEELRCRLVCCPLELDKPNSVARVHVGAPEKACP